MRERRFRPSRLFGSRRRLAGLLPELAHSLLHFSSTNDYLLLSSIPSNIMSALRLTLARAAAPAIRPRVVASSSRLLSTSAIRRSDDHPPVIIQGEGAKAGETPSNFQQATGLERFELLGRMQGIDVFDMKPLDASRTGTTKNPIVIQSLVSSTDKGSVQPRSWQWIAAAEAGGHSAELSGTSSLHQMLLLLKVPGLTRQHLPLSSLTAPNSTRWLHWISCRIARHSLDRGRHQDQASQVQRVWFR